MAELNFLEYNVNPNTHDIDDIVIGLTDLGFNKISVSNNGKASVWALNKCVLLVSTLSTCETGISGLGLNSKNAFEDSRNCETTGLNLAQFGGLNFYTYPVESFKLRYDEYFKTIDSAGTNAALNYFAGIVLSVDNVNNRNKIIENLRFRTVSTNENFISTVCESNRFNILWDLAKKKNKVHRLVFATDSIEDNVAKLVGYGYNSENLSKNKLDEIFKKYSKENFYPPKRFIQGWQINLEGKAKSFVLEKNFTDILPNLDIVISQRFNHNGLSESSMLYYDSINVNFEVI